MKPVFLKFFTLFLLASIAFALNSCQFTQRKVETTYPDGKPMKVLFYRNSDTGIETVKIEYYYSNGWLESVSNYKNEKKHGKAKTWYANGKLASKEFYKSGELNGKCLYYREDGTLSYKAEFNMGISDGKWIIYNDKGEPSVIQVFDNGKLLEQKNN